jgi:serine/threonine-protein kinase
MTPERFQQIEELYHAARARTGEDRAALLAQADSELRREVESLLAQPDSSKFLNRPALENAMELLGDPTVTMLTAGTCLGPYRIESKIGEGGMGAVYRATDTRLDREVALKFLSASLAHDANYIARFQREAKVLASLNHANIAIVHGLEESNGVRALVMELVDGPTLADRIAENVIPLKEALPIAEQITEALEAAHEKASFTAI